MTMKNNIFKKTITGFCILCLAWISTACDRQEENTVLPNADNLLSTVQKSDTSPQYDFLTSAKQPEEYSTYINKSTDLGLKMLKTENYAVQNTIVAPLSVSLSLSAMENGTAQDTLKELKNFVGKANFETDIINQCSAYISQRIRFFNKDGNGVFDTSTVWTDKKITVKRSFLQKYDNFYNMSFYRINFADSDTNTLIKQYIGTQSEKLLPVGTIDTKTTCRLYNDCSVAVSDYWLNDYADSAVHQGEFVTADKKKVSAEYLESVERTIKTDNATAFVKEFRNIPCKLLCIIPDDDVTLQEYIATLSYDKLLDIPNQIKPTVFAKVSIPKFSLEKSASLKKTLHSLGIKTLFSENADFSKGFAENLYLDDMTQSVKIAISENGITKTTKPENPSVPKGNEAKNTVVFDRPFVYAVIDNECNVPVLLGTITNPVV